MDVDGVVASAGPFRLAEGPVWDSARSRLLWVDIVAGAVHAGALEGEQVVPRDVLHRSDGMVGAVAVADDGTLLVAEQEVLVVLRPDGAPEEVARVVPAGERRRHNDGATDPAGRFLVGTMSLEEDPEDPPREVLVRLEADGSLTGIDDDLTLSNGLAWSGDGRSLFSVDTGRRTVFVRDYDASTGAVGQRRTHLRVDGGSPDGIAMDAEDHLWVAVHGAGQVRRYAPDGGLVGTVRVPAPYTTSLAFAGDDLRTLVITTATDELSEEEQQAHPLSGHLFTVRTDVPGQPVTTWRGLA